MLARIGLWLAVGMLIAGSALADPALRVSYRQGVPRVEIEGDYRQAHYTVWRSSALEGPYLAITDADLLCLGACFADDYGAVPGATYWYRFDLIQWDGTMVSFGPYRVVIPSDLRRIGAMLSNPVRGPSPVELFLAGAPGAPAVAAEAACFDLQGRRVSTVFRGVLSPGVTRIAWSARTDEGLELGAGTYFLRFQAADGRRSITRFVRLR